MCCYTHEERDKRDLFYNREETMKLFATTPELMCRCSHGVSCVRAMTQEDFLCDWCRDKDGSAIDAADEHAPVVWQDYPYGGHRRECADLERSWIGSTDREVMYDHYRLVLDKLGVEGYQGG